MNRMERIIVHLITSGGMGMKESDDLYSLAFDQIVLTRAERKLLKKISDQFLPNFRGERAADTLSRLGLAKKKMIVTKSGAYEYALEIEDRGRAYLSYMLETEKKRRAEMAKFVLSTLIAVLALLIAIASLAIDIWQLGIWQ